MVSEMERTNITLTQEARKQLQIRKQEWDMKNVSDVIIEALNKSGAGLNKNINAVGSESIVKVKK